MVTFVEATRSDFFQEFYDTCISKNGSPQRYTVVDRVNSLGFSEIGVVEKKSFCLSDFTRAIANLEQMVVSRLELSAVDNSDVRACELVHVAKCARFIQHCLKWSLAESMKEANAVSDLLEAKHAFKDVRLQALSRAGVLLQKDPFSVAVKNGCLKEAVQFPYTNDELLCAGVYKESLLLQAYSKQKMDLVWDLLALGIDSKNLPVSKEFLLRRAIGSEHENACLQLVQAIDDDEKVANIIKTCCRSSKLASTLYTCLNQRRRARIVQAAACVKKMPFVFACENGLTQDAVEFPYTKEALPTVRPYATELFLAAYTIGKMDLMLDLIGIAIPIPLCFPISNEALLQVAMDKRHRDASANLLLSLQSAQQIIASCHPEVECATPVETYKRCLFLQHVLQKVISQMTDPALKVLQAQFEQQRTAAFSQAVILSEKEPFVLAVEQGLWDEALSMQVSRDLLLKVKSNFSALIVEAYRAKKISFVLELIALGAEATALHGDLDLLLAAAESASHAQACRRLFTYGADPAKKNAAGFTLFSLKAPVIERNYAERKEFYKNIFIECEDVQRIFDTANSFTQVTTRLHEQAKALVEAARVKKFNPLQIAFLLHDETLARSMASFLSKFDFANYVDQLAQDFPRSNLECIEFAPYSINNAHFAKGVFDLNVEKPPQEVPLNRLLLLLPDLEVDSINTIQANLNLMIQRVEALIAFLGTPRSETRAIELFYQPIRYALQHLIIKLSEMQKTGSRRYQATLKEVMVELNRASRLCGGQYRIAPVLLYLKICKGIVLSADQKMYHSLAEYRGILAESLFENDEQGVHSYGNFVRRRGSKLGIPGYKVMASFSDSYVGSRADVNELERDFKKIYMTSNIVQQWMNSRVSDGELRDEFVDWHKAHVPACWEADHFDPIVAEIKKMESSHLPRTQVLAYLAQKGIEVAANETYEQALSNEREATYLGTWAFNMQSGKVRRAAICDMLVGLDIFHSCLIEHAKHSGTLLDKVKNIFSRFVRN